MRKVKKLGFLMLFAAAAFALIACHPPKQAPEGYAIVREHLFLSGKDMEPRISSNLDYTITEIDGAPVTREKVPPLVDMPAGVLISVGSHRIKAKVEPQLRPPNSKPVEVTFTAAVENRKIYYLVDDKEGQPVLIAVAAK